MDKLELRGDDVGTEGTKKRSPGSKDGDRPLKVARTRTLSNTGRLENISVPSHLVVEKEEVEVEHLVRKRGVK